jgi:hypothetical protein
MENHYKIGIGEGLDKLKFGMNRDEVRNIMGIPDEQDLETEDEEAAEMWIYSEKDLTLFFEGDEMPILVSIESGHKDTELFGKKVFDLSEKDIVALLQANGAEELEIEDEAWGEHRISFDDLMIDFYMENGKLNTVNWSMVISDDDE